MNTKTLLILGGAALATTYLLGFWGGGSNQPQEMFSVTDSSGRQIKVPASEMFKYGYTWLTAAQHGVQVDGWYKKQEYLNAVAQTSTEGRTWAHTVSDIAGSVPSLIEQGMALYNQVSQAFAKKPTPTP